MHDGRLRLIDRLRSEWRTKVWLGAVLGVLFCAGYFTIQRLTFRSAETFSPTWLDDAIGFSPNWVWAYQSIYLLFPTAWLATTRDELRRYAAGFILIMLIGFTFFLAWPVSGPRPVDAPVAGMYGMLITYDRPLNSFPSLHMALSTHAACFAVSLFHRRARVVAAVLGALWVALIGYATVATKQHYAVDVPAGIALGLFAHAVAVWAPSAIAARSRAATEGSMA